jgi:hypothetical protein
MIKLPPPPPRIASLPRDSRGYPVPMFVAWMKGGKPVFRGTPGAEPDFRIISPGFLMQAYRHGKCWICGGQMGGHRVFVMGPMCVINRVNSEPPSHRECAEYAALACPFLVKPRMRRLPADDIPDRRVAGILIERNPGCVALYETRKYEPVVSGDGVLFEVGAPERVDWRAEGRQATRAEVIASINSGYPILMAQASAGGREAVVDLERQRVAALRLVPA